jgi:C-terminal processing protease CtpA/Prc
VLLTLLLAFGAFSVAAQADNLPPAEIINDEGGAVSITGTMDYTNTLLASGVTQPVIILEDQAGFVDRDRGFLMPVESQVLGQITGDFYDPPFTYSIALPIQPQGTYRDVDNDGDADQGVQIYAVAYWSNTFGDAYLEERDLYGGGWSSAYASTLVSDEAERFLEVIGGTLLVYAPDDQQGFPSGFGADGLLFTDDDPTVRLPQGYTVVDLDSDPFTFDRSANPVIDLIEPEGAALDDFSAMSYTEAFDAMLDKFVREYAFTDYKNIDWDALAEIYRPRFEQADADRDSDGYGLALRDFLWEIPDNHIALYPQPPILTEQLRAAAAGSIGMSIRETDDGRVLVTYLTDGAPASEAGIELGAQIAAINDTPIDDWISETFAAYDAPFSTAHSERLAQLQFATRFPFGSRPEITFTNPDGASETVTLETISEVESFFQSSLDADVTGIELPVEYRLLDSGLIIVSIYSFSDNDLLSIQIWERLMGILNDNQIPGLIIDMRSNGGGSGFLADQMAAYFFDETLELGNTSTYDRSQDAFVTDPDLTERFFLPDESLRYDGEIAVLVSPNCRSACEFFAYDMTLQDRAVIVGQYPTGGLGGGITDFAMPEGIFVRMTVGRAVDANGDIHIEGRGVAPTLDVPVDERTLFSDGDPVLEAAESYLIEQIMGETSDAEPPGDITVIEGGDIAPGDKVSGQIAENERIAYVFTPENDVTVTITLSDETGELDTYLRVYLGDDIIANNDDIETGIDLNSRVEALELTGGETYIIEVGTYNDSGAGAYALQILQTD